MYLLCFPVVSIWRKADQYNARYDQKSDGAVMLSAHHGRAMGHIRLLARAMLHSGSVRYRMAIRRRMSLIPHQLRFWYKRVALTSVSGSAHFVNLVFAA